MAGEARSGNPRRLSGRLALFATLSALLIVGVALQGDGAEREGWQLAARLTARWSFAWFALAFSASALARLLPGEFTRGVLRERRGIGLGFAGAHTVHLAAIGGFVANGGPVEAGGLIGGGLAYLLILAMAVTSNDAAQRLLGARRWRGLHLVGGYYLWFAFALSYAERVGAQPPVAPVYWLLLALALAVPGLRVLAALRARRPRDQRSAV